MCSPKKKHCINTKDFFYVLLKVIIYEKPFFEGNHIELDSELVALAEEGNNNESSELGTEPLTSIGSIKVTGGVYV